MPALTVVTFAALAVALLALWFRAPTLTWLAPGIVAIVAALASGVIHPLGVAFLCAFGGICVAARVASGTAMTVATHAALVAGCAALFLHVVPGFENPVLIQNAVTSPGALPYAKFLNFDKGMAALLILGLYMPERTSRDPGFAPGAFMWRFVLMVLAVLVPTLLAGYVRWDPKLPEWWAVWVWSMVFLTALPEETLFRGCVQTWLSRAIPGAQPVGFSVTRGASGPATVPWLPVVVAGVLFGLAHAGGGATYVLLASIAGVGYGWIYASTGSLAAATLAHAGLNTTHLVLFTYPALAR